MQRKEIEVGGDYAVYIERLGDKGDNVGYHHSPKLLPRAQVLAGVPVYKSRGNIVKARVVALDVLRLHRQYGGYVDRHDGVLIEFAEPFDPYGRRADNGEEPVTEAVVTTKHLLEPWSARESREAEQKRQRRERAESIDREAAVFASRLTATIEQMSRVFDGVQYDDEDEEIRFNGGKLDVLGDRGSDGEWKPTRFGAVRVDTESFLSLVTNVAVRLAPHARR